MQTLASEDVFEDIIRLITRRTGIIPRSSHRGGIDNYIKKVLASRNMTARAYYAALLSDKALFTELVNEATINETYFFREEQHFRLLRKKLFPMWLKKFGQSPIHIWSAACSNGEEVYSLALVAKECGLQMSITASDINTDVLRNCKNGVFKASSQRPNNAMDFRRLLTPYLQMDGTYLFDNAIRSLITTMQLNLSEVDSPANAAILPKRQHIIFIRNVFIYFSMELRLRILKTLSERCLCSGGYIFVSTSEIASLDSAALPPDLKKEADGNVFYFHKTMTGGTPNGKSFR